MADDPKNTLPSAPVRKSDAGLDLRSRYAWSSAPAQTTGSFVLDAGAAALKAVLEPHEAAFAVLRIVRAGSMRAAVERIAIEWQEWVAAGYIGADYATSVQAQMNLTELLEALTTKNLDQVQIDLLRKIYLVMASETASNRDDPKPSQFMLIARELNSGEVLVLFATHQLVTENLESIRQSGSSWTPEKWVQLTQQRTRLEYEELVLLHEDSLAKKHLLTQRMYSDRSGFRHTKFGNLTSLGHAFCEFVLRYDALAAQLKKA